MDILKIAMAGLCGVFLALQFQTGKKEFSLLIAIVTGMIIFFYAVSKLSGVVSMMQSLQKLMEIDEKYIELLIKMIGITYVSEFSSNICRDAGYQGIGKQIEMFGKLCIFGVSLSVIHSLINLVEGLFEG